MVLLAAGSSRRFGAENKLLAPLDGRPLYRHVLDRLCGFQSDDTRLLVITNTPEIQHHCDQHRIPWLDSPLASEGQSRSVRRAAEAVPPEDDILFFVADQPWLGDATIRAFLNANAASGKGLGCIAANGRRGNPAWFAPRYRAALLAQDGDQGGRAILAQHEDDLFLCPAQAAEFRDVDRPEDLLPDGMSRP